MKKLIVPALAVMAAAASPAYAAPAPSITFTPGVYSLPTYAGGAAVFETFENATSGGTQYNPSNPSQKSSNAFTETVGGGMQGIFNGDVPSQAARPDTDTNKFLSVESGFYNVNFGTAGVQFFSFVFGSLDSYNTLRVAFSDGTLQSFGGRQIIGGTNTAGVTTYGDSGRVSFNANGGPSFTAIQFESNGAAFEIDDLAAAAPEPATWALMILGFGLVGSQLRSRRRSTKVSFA